MGLLADIQAESADATAAATANGVVTTAQASLATAQAAAAAAQAQITTDSVQLVTDLTAAPYNGIALYQDPTSMTFSVYTLTPSQPPGYAVQPVTVAS